MNEEQIKSLIDQLKGAGLEEEQIMDVFYETFSKGKMDRKDLETLANALGYELTDDFKNDSTPDPIEGGEDLGDVSKEDLEDAKGFSEDESKEEFEDKIEDIKEDESKEEEKPEDKDEDKDEGKGADAEDSEKSESESESEDKEWEEANKLFKL